jgi:hypothetical protein
VAASRSIVLTIALLAIVAPLGSAALGTAPPRLDLLSDGPFAAFEHLGPYATGAPGLKTSSGNDVDVTPYGQAQNEPALAISPTNPDFMVAAWNDYLYNQRNDPYVWNGVGISHDGGATWNSGLMSPNPHDSTWDVEAALLSEQNQAATSFAYGGDPIAAINGNGTALVGQIMFDARYDSDIFVQPYSAVGEASPTQNPSLQAQGMPDLRFGLTAIDASSGRPAGGLTDKPWMVADPNGPNFYVTWTQFAPCLCQSSIMLSRSTDGQGATWSKPVTLSGSAPLTQGSDSWVGADHAVYVAYVTLDGGCLVCSSTVYVVKSTDGGATWSSPSRVATAPGLDMPNANFRYAIFPHIAVSPVDGRIVVIWPQGAGDVMSSVSLDGGATWSAPVDVLPSPNAQYFPDIASDSRGTFTVGLYDASKDPANRFAHYSLVGSPDGFAWGAPRAIQVGADDSFNTKWWFMGDYTTVATDSNDVVHAVWTDTSGSDQDIHAGK